MDKIKLQEMAFYGHHGVDSEENTLGQRFSSMWKWTWICPVQVKAITLKIR